jgi:hypothetical protein
MFFAGEACSAHDFSTAHGAWRTGIAAAEAAIAATAKEPPIIRDAELAKIHHAPVGALP